MSFLSVAAIVSADKFFYRYLEPALLLPHFISRCRNEYVSVCVLIFCKRSVPCSPRFSPQTSIREEKILGNDSFRKYVICTRFEWDRRETTSAKNITISKRIGRTKIAPRNTRKYVGESQRNEERARRGDERRAERERSPDPFLLDCAAAVSTLANNACAVNFLRGPDDGRSRRWTKRRKNSWVHYTNKFFGSFRLIIIGKRF